MCKTCTSIKYIKNNTNKEERLFSTLTGKFFKNEYMSQGQILYNASPLNYCPECGEEVV